ncbi:MAG: THUMP domain-containing protein [Promethearchaeota archaeon]
MQKNFNLLISCARFHEKDAIAEIWYLFSNINDDEVKGEQTIFPGLVIAKTNQNPIESVKKLRIFIKNDPLYMRFVLKVVPIEVIVETCLENIIKIVKKFEARITKTETFRITVKSRFSPLNSQNLIIKAAEFIDRKVNLTKPDLILRLEILGSVTGISLLRPMDILSKAEFTQPPDLPKRDKC